MFVVKPVVVCRGVPQSPKRRTCGQLTDRLSGLCRPCELSKYYFEKGDGARAKTRRRKAFWLAPDFPHPGDWSCGEVFRLEEERDRLKACLALMRQWT